MITRWLLLLVTALTLAGCAQFGDSVQGLFGQRENVPKSEAPPDAPPPATLLNVVPRPVPQAEPTPIIDPANTEALDSERVICEEKGGLWSRVGGRDAFTCVSATRDANRFCTAANHCEGHCLARSGTCAPFTPLVGCHDVVSPDGGMVTICID
ncbi:MAG: hypothetical protein AAGG54_09210 [Pseudomonadota bacterium]